MVMIGAPHRLAWSQVAPRPFANATATEPLVGVRERVVCIDDDDVYYYIC